MIITRPHHPFQGQSLAVFGALNKKGRLLLVLTLPDQSRAHVPADWTDLNRANPAAQLGSPVLGSTDDLLRARSFVDALVNRSPSNRQADSKLDKERKRATESRIPKSSRSGKSDMGEPR